MPRKASASEVNVSSTTTPGLASVMIHNPQFCVRKEQYTVFSSDRDFSNSLGSVS